MGLLGGKGIQFRQRLSLLLGEVSSLDRRFGAFVADSPMSLIEIQRLLGNDEAVVIVYPQSARLMMTWAVTREGAAWSEDEPLDNNIDDKIRKLRVGLDRKACRAQSAMADAATCEDVDTLPFNLASAHELYKRLLNPVEGVIKGKKHLIIVAPGALASLPFNVLVTEQTSPGFSGSAAYSRASWLVKRYALTVLPAVSSLKALREFSIPSKAPKPFLGIGDPDFGNGATGSRRTKIASNAAPRAFSDYFRGALADNAILHSLPPLPETSDELVNISNSFGAKNSDLILGKDASETNVKAMSAAGKLKQYRVIAFATHGLVSGEFKGLPEPGLALTVPDKPTDADDGLLTASEVTGLKLDADWVVLSACNTAAGDKPGAEALSGLAKAFFYAGARAILVSNWPVETNAAEFLTTHTFDAMEEAANVGRPIGRAEALRRAELALIADPSTAHPALWAPFMVVGEGGIPPR